LGIGYATAKAFLGEGAKVAITGRSGARLARAVRSLRADGPVVGIRGDVSKSADARRFVAETSRRLGAIDVLVNNAGVWVNKTLQETTEREYDYEMGINLKGPFFCSKYVLPGMRRRKRGAIVNVSSISGLVGSIGSSIYCASKAALILLTQTLALEVAKDGIRVNAICPGEVDTPMNEVAARDMGLTKAAYYRQLSKTIPMGRVASPDEIARAILFLASDESPYMTGTALVVDGGFVAQ
jgi:NAD(P)-dependent dehydrogenase (short-subunit alcohol dehydrogenase family)